MGGFKYHIDFSGGAEINVSFEKSIDIGVLRKAIGDEGWKDTVIQSVGKSGRDFIIRIGGATVEGLEDTFRAAVDKATPNNTMIVNHIDWVGAAVGYGGGADGGSGGVFSECGAVARDQARG